nr:hypothetical protein [Candidatus Cloacimonadota bacterium]
MPEISLKMCSKLALKAGSIILESGGATNRVELMMYKVCKGFGFEEIESFVTPTGIFLSIGDGKNELSTSIRRVEQRRIDLGKITDLTRVVNTLYEDNCAKCPPEMTKYDYFRQELEKIDTQQPYPSFVTNLCGAATSGSFCLIFGGTGLEFALAMIVGFIVSASLKYISLLPVNNFLLNAIAASIIVILSKTMQLGFQSINLDTIIVGGIMILVPGLSITNAIRDTMSGDLVAGTARGVEALIITVGIVAGSGAMLKLWEIILG